MYGIYANIWIHLGYIDGKCYHIYIAYMDPMGDGIHWDFTNNRHGGFSGDLSNKHGGLMGIESTNMVNFTWVKQIVVVQQTKIWNSRDLMGTSWDSITNESYIMSQLF